MAALERYLSTGNMSTRHNNAPSGISTGSTNDGQSFLFFLALLLLSCVPPFQEKLKEVSK